MVKATALQQARKLTERLERLHDIFNERYGSNHEYTQELMSAFMISYGVVVELEGDYEMNVGE